MNKRHVCCLCAGVIYCPIVDETNFGGQSASPIRPWLLFFSLSFCSSSSTYEYPTGWRGHPRLPASITWLIISYLRERAGHFYFNKTQRALSSLAKFADSAAWCCNDSSSPFLPFEHFFTLYIAAATIQSTWLETS